MTSPRIRFIGLLLFIASQTLAAEKPSARVKHNFPSQQQEGLIGITEALPLDNPADNIFHVTIDEQVCAEDKVWLVYELDGVEDHSNVSRSVNDQLAIGGYVVKKRRGWALQREELNGTWLKQGDNVVRFTLPSSANHSYRVKNLRVEIEKGSAENERVQVVFNQPSAIHYQSKAYIKGFVKGDVSAVRIGGKNILFTGGEFESLIDLTLIQNSCTVDVEVVNADGSSSCHAVNFSESAHADYVFTRDGVYYEVETFFSNKEKQDLELHRAHLVLEGGALQAPSFLSITTLRDVDIPALDAGMVNVTAKHAAFRFLPNGTKFGKDVKLTIPFDTKQIPDGYTEQDIKTYYFDEQNHHWVAVPTDTVLLESGLIVSNTTHFTDYINAIIKVPESPEVNAYNSTSMKGIKAANPTAAVNLISPPQANNSGSASLGYPINIPAGRAGMQPQLGINYNSGGGNGWMGLGWNLAVPSISIDTRWGVPRYDSDKETETYTFNGEQLSPVAHRGTLENRSTANVKRFYPRVEGSFNKIERFGKNPAEYYWVVTDKSGTKYFYGAIGGNSAVDKQSVLRTNEEGDGGNIAQWMLSEVRDLNGNTVKYYYAKPDDVGVKSGTVKGYQIYVSKITYTGTQGSDGKYSVTFLRDRDLGGANRQDVSIAANLGFKQVTADLLKKIEVKFNNKLIRSYVLNYTIGAFYKTLLQNIQEFDAQNKPFTKHDFQYYNDVATTGKLFQSKPDEEKWNTVFDDVRGEMVSNIDGFTDEATAFSGTKGFEGGASGTMSVGLGGNVTTKLNSVGGSIGISGSWSQGVLSMIDVNGDGLQDKLFVVKEGNETRLMYRPNRSSAAGSTTFGEAIPITGIDLFHKESSKTGTLGVEANAFSALMAGANGSITQSKTTYYFTEANGDQFIDIVKKGVVYFNHYDPATGRIEYSPTSTNTHSTIEAGENVSGDLIDRDAERIELEKAITKNPLHDVVRMWKAPFNGIVNVTGQVQLIQSNDVERLQAPADGVRVAVQVEGTERWNAVISADDYIPRQANVGGITVKKDDRIFFRVGSRNNGQYDSVRWEPVISYLSPTAVLRDANGKNIYRYETANDFVLATKQSITPPVNGTVNITGEWKKPKTTDDLDVYVLRTHDDSEGRELPTRDTVWHKHYRWDESVPGTIDIPNLQVKDNEHYYFKVVSATNVDWPRVIWKPIMKYTSVEDPTLNITQNPIQAMAIPEYTMYNSVRVQSKPYRVSLKNVKKDTVTITPQLAFRERIPFRDIYPFDGEITFSVKKLDSLIAKVALKIEDGKIVTDTALTVIVRNNDALYVEFHGTHEQERAEYFLSAITSNSAVLKGKEVDATMLTGYYTTLTPTEGGDEIIFGNLHRGWGQFIWNGNRTWAEQPIEVNLLKLSDQVTKRKGMKNSDVDNLANSSDGNSMSTDDTYDVAADRFVVLMASARDQRWSGMDQFVSLNARYMSSSRLGDDDLSPLTFDTGNGTTTGAGAKAIDKINRSTSLSFTAGFNAGFGLSQSVSQSWSNALTDYVDMNGDRYPDIVSEKLIQYTAANGGLSTRTLGVEKKIQKSGAVTLSASVSGSAGIPTAKFMKPAKGNPAVPQVSAGSASSTNGADAKKDKINIGVNGGVVSGSNSVKHVWMDVNGDGLPDKVSIENDDKKTMVALNVGYGFLNAEDWGIDVIQRGKSDTQTGGASLGMSKGNNSFSLGVSLARSDNWTNASIQDMNGDGLPDLVQRTDSTFMNGPVKVRLNTGNSFAEPVAWDDITAISENATASESANVAFTFGITVAGVVKYTITPSVNLGATMSREKTKISDIDGDGYPDFLTSSNDGEIKVRRSTIGRTNMLKDVKRPLGASFALDYERVGNTYNLPHSQWVMKSVVVRDGFKNDGVDSLLTTFVYDSGFYNRHERESYGFKKVISRTHDTSKKPLPVYTEVTQTFNNSDYFKKGLLLTEVMTDGAGNKYVEKVNTYAVTDVIDGVKFPTLTKTEQKFYEGQSSDGKSTGSTYQYDAIGNVIAYTDKGDEGSEDDLSATISYHDIDGLYIKGTPKSIVVTGNGTTYRKRETVIDPATGNIKQIKQYLSDSEVSVHDMEYDTYGNLTKITRPTNSKGQRMSFNYEYDGTVFTYTTKVSNSYGYSSTALYDFSFGQVLKSIDLNGHEITYELDDLGRVASVTGPYEKGGANKTISFEYHPEAEVPWALTNHYDPANPKNSMQTSIFVDGLGRVLQTKKDGALYDGEGKPDKEVMVVSGRVKFDAFGRTISALYPVTEPVGTPGAFNFNEDTVKPTTTEYDVLNRTLKVTLPDLSVTSTAYGFESDRNGKKQFSTKTTDANGKQTEQFTDVRGRVMSVKNYTSTDPVWTSFRYNAINEQIEATDDLGHTTFSTYDNFGRRIERKHPDAGITQYSYDLAGNLKELVTVNLAKEGGAITYAYDFERLTAITYPHNPENNVKYTYGAMGATDNRTGRIVTQEDASGAQEFFYGPLGEVVKNIRTVVIPQHDEQTYTTEWTYDTWNRLTSMTYADGEKVDYTYNAGGLLRSMSGKKKSESFAYVNQLGYDKFEQRVFLAYGNGTKTTYTYEEDRRRLKNMTAQTAAKRLFMDNAYEYDKVNNILSLKNNAPIPNANLMGGASEYSYAYDDLYRLTSAQGSYKGANDEHTYTLAMSYNSVGGITQKVQNHQRKGQEQKKTSYTLNYTYSESQPHAPVHIGENAYTYDASGNQTGWTSDVSGQRRQVMWDEENRIRAIQDNGSIYHYIYDASGERVLKGKSTGQRVFVNGEWKAGSGGMGNYTVYVNPYLVLKSGGYTKHYYIEGQRIVSKLGSGMDTNGKGPLKAGGDKIDYAAKGQRIFDGIVKNLKFLGADGQILTAGKSGKVPPGQINGGSTSTAETFRYFYHPDHLGSTSYITDASGEVYQHLEYMAFGETFVEEHSNTERTPYLFNGKELDEETGLYYYGARYYDARTSVWVSVDALSDYQTGLSPYIYANNNPIVFIDPDGNMAMKWPPEFWEKHGTRIMGGLKVLGGAAEMVAGGAAILTPEPTMVTKVVGVAAVAHGADTMSSGLMQLLTGQDQSTLTSEALQAGGLSKQNSDLIDGGISIALTGGAGALAKTPQLSSAANATANTAREGNLANKIGAEFENLLVKKFGGSGPFKSAGREFDGAFGNVWYEAKAGNFWNNVGLKDVNKWKSSFGQYQSIAKQNGKTYQVYSEKAIPQIFKDFFDKKGIQYFENVSK